ncbi:MAG: hypothetical protein ACRCSU_10360 [Paracoccaceae bacterium]
MSFSVAKAAFLILAQSVAAQIARYALPSAIRNISDGDIAVVVRPSRDPVFPSDPRPSIATP